MPSTNPLVIKLVDHWRTGGAKVQSLSVEELCKECPELVPEVQNEIEAIQQAAIAQTLQISSFGNSTSEPGIDSPDGPTDDGVVFEVSRYRNLQFLARGGIGEVFTAVDEDLNRSVAIKFIRPGKEQNEQNRLQFAVEGQVTARLEHPGVVPVYGVGYTTEGRPFQIMRLIRGGCLREAIRAFHGDGQGDASQQSASTVPELRMLLRRMVSVCQTLAYAHTRGVVHRDVKPENIMLGQYGETLVVDWGLAMPYDKGRDGSEEGAEETLHIDSVEALRSSQSGVSGTPSYMSPEQAMGLAEIGPASDIYSLGATLFELLTGQVPFKAKSAMDVVAKVRHGQFAKPSQLNAKVPRALESICLKAMSHDPEDRYPTASAMAADLDRWIAGERVTAYQETRSEKLRRWAREHRQLAQAIAVTALLLIVGGSAWSTAVVLQKNSLIDQRMSSLVAQADLKERLLIGGVENLRQDILLLAKRPQLATVARAVENGVATAAEKDDLAAEFEAILGLNPGYMQVRLLGLDGREKVRVDRKSSGSAPFRLADDALQDKGGKDYYRDTKTLAAGDVYLSEININMELGQHQWETPTIRAAAPVFASEDSHLLGVVVVNMHFDRVSELLKNVSHNNELLVFLTDEDGRFLSVADVPEVAFCFERGLSFPVETLYSQLGNFRTSVSLKEMQEADVSPNPSILVSASKQDSPEINKLADNLMAADMQVRLSRYANGDVGSQMLIATGPDAKMLRRVTKEINSTGADAQLSAFELGKSTSTNRHAIYARKIFFDPSSPDRFLCLVLARPH